MNDSTPTRPDSDSASPSYVHGHARKHGESPTYRTWMALRNRCLNPRQENYYKHGGRGIKVCAAWSGSHGFPVFLADVGEKPEGDYSLDRVDNDGHYSCGHCEECTANGWPMNCRWATRFEQGSNKRNNRTFEYNGRRYTIAEAVREFGIPRGTLLNRQRRGWTGEQIVNQPKCPGVKLECRMPR